MTKRTKEQRQAMQQEALARATNPSEKNAMLVLMAADAAGITDAQPGKNVFTYNAWKAKGRQVRKGQKALCKLPVFYSKKNEDGSEEKRMTSAAVFHISQTDTIN